MCSLLVVEACQDRSSSTQDSAPSIADSAIRGGRDEPLVLSTTKPMKGPRVVVDSSAAEPRLVSRNNEYILLLPVAMARVLMDTLPGFEPSQLSSWPAARVANIVSENPDVSLASVVLGDFNGDSKTDVAMQGNAGRVGATFMLLAQSDSVPIPRIFLIDRGDAVKPTGDSYISLMHPQKITDPLTQEVLDLRVDAVHYIVIEKASVVYYLDRGVIREYSTSD